MMTSHRSLLVPQLLEHASVQSATAEVVSAHPHSIHRSSFKELHHRARRLASALAAIGVRPGDRIASIAWNDHRHLELYFAVTAMGAALHTIDPMSRPAVIRDAVLAAGDRFVCFDVRDGSHREPLLGLRPNVLGMIAMGETGAAAGLGDVLDYEKLLAEHQHECDWVLTEETAIASLTAVAGQPNRLVTATHRATASHAVTAWGDDIVAPDDTDSVLLAVPLFLPGSWSLACAVAISGANLLLPAPNIGASRLFEVLRDEKVTLMLATPDVLAAMVGFLDVTQTNAMQSLSLRSVIACGDPLHPAVQARLIHAFGPDVVSTGRSPPDEGGLVMRINRDDQRAMATRNPGDADESCLDQS